MSASIDLDMSLKGDPDTTTAELDCDIDGYYLNLGGDGINVRLGLDDEHLFRLSATLKEWGVDCEHKWVSADNKHVSGCEICTHCKTLRPKPNLVQI